MQQVRVIYAPTDQPLLTPPLEHATITEQVQLLQSLQRCLELRDKYMLKSGQRIGDDPRDYDGRFQPFSDEHADVCGVRPDVAIDAAKSQSQANSLEPWHIYPKPPPPHWHWKDNETVISIDGTKSRPGDNGFNFGDCTIPGEHLGWSFGIDVKGVFQVYDDAKGTPLQVILSPYTSLTFITQTKKRMINQHSIFQTFENISWIWNSYWASSQMVQPRALLFADSNICQGSSTCMVSWTSSKS